MATVSAPRDSAFDDASEEALDLCIIGAGTAGFSAAETARELGRRFVVVSGEGALGGTCILSGCMPAKTLLSTTERLGLVEDGGDLGIELRDVHVDIPAIIARKRELVEYFAEDRVHELEHYRLLRGTARFVAPDAIEVDGRRVVAKRFIVATGSWLVPPDVPGLRESGFLTNDDVLNLEQVPQSIAILGAGPVGCEFAQYFARLGASVTLIQREKRILRNEDADVSSAIAEVLRGDGVCVMTDVAVSEVRRDGDARVLSFGKEDHCADIRVDAIVVTAERRPNSAALELDCAGVDSRDGAVVVDDTLRTSNPRVYAAGDVIGRRCLVHAAAACGRIAALNALSTETQAVDFERLDAHGVYTQPQVAVAGLTETECHRRGFDVAVARHPFADIGKAVVAGEPEGFIKMLAHRDGRVAGVAIVGANAIDLIAEAMVWMDRGATVSDVAALKHLHPTVSEIYNCVAEKVERAVRRRAAAPPA